MASPIFLWVLTIKGVTFLSYRYAWAERAKRAGYPERYAQKALGHNSKAIHHAYARNALVELPVFAHPEINPRFQVPLERSFHPVETASAITSTSCKTEKRISLSHAVLRLRVKFMNRQALQKILAEIEDLIDEAARVNEEPDAPNLPKVIQGCFVVGKLQAARDILKGIDGDIEGHGL